MEWIKLRWRKAPRSLRRLLVFVVGWTVVIAGIAMLALPGPGWATIFLGFTILAHEFASARQIRDWLVDKLKKVIELFKKSFQIK